MLMVDVSSNIDDNLGVRKLVKTPVCDQGDPTPEARSRRNLDHWTTNNGSVQFFAPLDVADKQQHSKVSESHRQNHLLQAGNTTTPPTNGSSLSLAAQNHHSVSKYMKANSQLNGIQSGSSMVTNNPNYQTLRPSKQNKTKTITNECSSINVTGEQLEKTPTTPDPASNWSNGTGASSDLLF